MEKLHELHEEGRFDLLVLDTPPTRNALDFLDAPERLSRFVDSRSLQFFLRPSRTGLKILGRGTGLLFSVLKRATGIDLLEDLSEFFQSFGDMADGFRDRATAVTRLLADRRTAFVVVSSPQRDSVEEAIFFGRRLAESRMPLSAAVVNRVHPMPPGAGTGGEALDPEAVEVLGEALARKVGRNFGDYRALASHDAASVSRLTSELGGAHVITIPHLDDDVHDLGGLAQMNRHLFSAAGRPGPTLRRR